MNTQLMNKMFSDSTSAEFKDKVAEKIEEARNNGTAELKVGTESLKLADVGNGQVAIQDDANNQELTVATKNDKGEEVLTNETKVKSETLPSISVPKSEGVDGEPLDDTVPEVTVSIEPSIADPEKAGMERSFSIKFSGFPTQESANNYLSNMEMKTNTFSDRQIWEVESSAERLFSSAENIDENTTFSDVEDTYEGLVRLYSDLEVLHEHGYNVEALANNTIAYSEFLEGAYEEGVNRVFSDMCDIADTANQLFSIAGDIETVEDAQAVFSELEGLYEVAVSYSDICDMSEVIEGIQAYSEQLSDWSVAQMIFSDAEVEVLENNIKELDKAVEDLKETKDEELAKKVKVLSEDIIEDVARAKESGRDVSRAEEKVAEFSEVVKSILTPEEAKELSPEELESAKKAEAEKVVEEGKTFSRTIDNSVKQFSGSTETELNACFSSVIY